MTYPWTPKCLQLRNSIICPECLKLYTVVKGVGDVALRHPLNRCGRNANGRTTEYGFMQTAYIPAKPIGDGIALIQLPYPFPNCDDCSRMFARYTVDTLRVIFKHGEIYCRNTVSIPSAQLMIFI